MYHDIQAEINALNKLFFIDDVILLQPDIKIKK